MTDSISQDDGILIIDEGYQPRLNETSKKFIEECVAEKERLGDDFPWAVMLICEAIDKVQATGRIPGREYYADVFKQKLIKVSQKVFVPIKQFPKFNFNGKLLGPKGSSHRNLQNETMCKILIKGRNSMRDSTKEEELRQSGDPRHSHLNKDLYYEIQTVAPPAEAHARVAYALAEIRKYLIPDSNDEVSQIQRKDILADPELAKKSKKYRDNPVRRQPYGGTTFSRPDISVLNKFRGYIDQSYDEEIPDYEMTKIQYNPQRQQTSRSSSSYYQQRNNHDGERYQTGRKPVVGVLENARGQKYDDEDEYEQERRHSYQTGYDDEDRSHKHNNYPPMQHHSISQRQPIKRTSKEASFQRRYENPEKRGR